MLVTKIMTATAHLSARCVKPVYHPVIAWHPGEQPTPAAMRTVAETTRDEIRLGEHQALIVAHGDRDSRHLHVVLNCVHPATGVARSTAHDWRCIERSGPG
jgi:hypothetical protein